MSAEPCGSADSEPWSLADDERVELTWLRNENALLRVERDILLRVATGYAEDMDILLRRGAHPPSP